MSYRQLEDFINKWTLELEEQEAIFLEQATQVNAWDRLLIDNGDKVCELLTSNALLSRVHFCQLVQSSLAVFFKSKHPG